MLHTLESLIHRVRPDRPPARHTTSSRPRRARAGTAVAASAVALVAAAGVATPASADLVRTGPVDPATGFPAWYSDQSGLALQLCLDGAPNCVAAAAELVPPDGEAFYWMAVAEVPLSGPGVPAGTTVAVEHALEAAYLGTTPIVFDRLRVRGTVPSTGNWTVNHPFGTDVIPVTALGPRNLNFTDDVGCAPAEPGDVCNFDAARAGRITNFLRSTAPADPGYIGDFATAAPVTGGTARNTVQIVGPNGESGVTADWIIQGKTANGPIASVPQRSVVFPGSALTQTATRQVKLYSVGTQDMTVSGVTLSGSSVFTKQADGCTGVTVRVGSSCTVTLGFRPMARATYTASLSFATNALSNPAPVAISGSGAVLPAAPGMQGATAGNRTATVRWSPPSDNGGSPISSYRVLVRNLTSGASSVLTTSAAARSQTITATVGHTYVFNVYAVNAIGRGPGSATSNPVTGASVPAAPTIGAASSGSTADSVVSAVARWSGPSFTGGMPLTAYRVIAVRSDGAITTKLVSPSARAYNFAGLLRNVTYRFQVQAVNSLGSSPRSALSNAVVAR